MVYSEPLPISKRIGLLASIAATHLALIILLMNLRAEPHADISKSSPLSVALLKADVEIPKPVHAALPTKQPVPSDVKPISMPDRAPPVSAPNTGTEGCQVLEELQNAITANPDAQAAIDQLPAEAQSLSDATVIWNADWTDVASAPGAPLATVRDTIVQTLGSVDSPCLHEPMVGPRMIAVPSAGETRLLVIGSGTWSWQQLAESGTPAADARVQSTPSVAVGSYVNRQKEPLGNAQQ